ncbi:hypothetical protein [Eoetvoesiella caeni]
MDNIAVAAAAPRPRRRNEGIAVAAVKRIAIGILEGMAYCANGPVKVMSIKHAAFLLNKLFYFNN